MGKTKSSKFEDNREFTCSAPALVEPGDSDYPYKVMLYAVETATHVWEGLLTYRGNLRRTLGTCIESKYPIFVVKKNITTRPIKQCMPSTTYAIRDEDYSPWTGEQYYVATFKTASEFGTKITLLGTYNSHNENEQNDGGVTIYDRQYTVRTVDASSNRYSFYRDYDGTYQKQASGYIPSEVSVTGRFLVNGEPLNTTVPVLFNGGASETTTTNGYFMNVYDAQSVVRSDEPYSSPSLQITSDTRFISFMNHEGSGQSVYSRGVQSLSFKVHTTKTEINNPHFSNILEWFDYCRNME